MRGLMKIDETKPVYDDRNIRSEKVLTQSEVQTTKPEVPGSNPGSE
jgi:hypothetical protein